MVAGLRPRERPQYVRDWPAAEQRGDHDYVWFRDGLSHVTSTTGSRKSSVLMKSLSLELELVPLDRALLFNVHSCEGTLISRLQLSIVEHLTARPV